VLVNFAKTYFTGALPDIWLFALGGLFVAVTLFLPKGLVGTLPSFRIPVGQRTPSAPAIPKKAEAAP
jgi:urea transport system permease protein